MKWTFFPKNKRITDDMMQVVEAFQENDAAISSNTHTLVSDEVLQSVSESLENIGYTVEKKQKR